MDRLNEQSAHTGGHTDIAVVCLSVSLLNRRNAHPGHVTAHPGSSPSAGMQQEQGNVGPGEGGPPFILVTSRTGRHVGCPNSFLV
jgi:hypothetical protein